MILHIQLKNMRQTANSFTCIEIFSPEKVFMNVALWHFDSGENGCTRAEGLSLLSEYAD
jgi:hypothetical protein